MNQEASKKRKERLAQLLTKNKVRLARNTAMGWYQQKLGYQLKAEQFIDLEVSHHILREAYHKIHALREERSIEFTSLQNAQVTLFRLKEQTKDLDEKSFVFYYKYSRETGGIKIKLKNFWSLLEQIGNDPDTDIIMVDEHLAFGICIEIEEYTYLVTSWGFEKKA